MDEKTLDMANDLRKRVKVAEQCFAQASKRWEKLKNRRYTKSSITINYTGSNGEPGHCGRFDVPDEIMLGIVKAELDRREFKFKRLREEMEAL